MVGGGDDESTVDSALASVREPLMAVTGSETKRRGSWGACCALRILGGIAVCPFSLDIPDIITVSIFKTRRDN